MQTFADDFSDLESDDLDAVTGESKTESIERGIGPICAERFGF